MFIARSEPRIKVKKLCSQGIGPQNRPSYWLCLFLNNAIELTGQYQIELLNFWANQIPTNSLTHWNCVILDISVLPMTSLVL